MVDGQEGVSVVAFERRPERLSIRGGNFGFHYTAEDYIDARVESLRKIYQDAGVDISIYGVSGKIYWPRVTPSTQF